MDDDINKSWQIVFLRKQCIETENGYFADKFIAIFLCKENFIWCKVSQIVTSH